MVRPPGLNAAKRDNHHEVIPAIFDRDVTTIIVRFAVTTKPLKILLAAGDPTHLQNLSGALHNHQAMTVSSASTPHQVLTAIKAGAVDVLVVDETLAETSGLQFVREVVSAYPLINCALVSTLPPDEFHEATEGLGVFMQVPPRPGPETAAEMIGVLDRIYGLLAATDTDRRRS